MVKIKDGFQGSQMVVLPHSVVEEMRHDEFMSALFVTDIGYYPRARHHYRRREQGISSFILIYCRDGEGWIECNGHKKHQLSANQFFIIPAGAPHAYGADAEKPWSIYWMHFEGRLASFYGTGYDHPCSIPASEQSRIVDRLSIFEEIYNTLEIGYGAEQLHFAVSALYHFLGSFKYIDAFRSSGAHVTAGYDIIGRARHFMLENIEQKITLGQTCEFLGYSESYCSTIFRKYTGMSPIQYLLHLRIQTACQLLDVTNMKINQICHKVGIEDPYYFSRLFSKIMNMSPQDYRQHRRV